MTDELQGRDLVNGVISVDGLDFDDRLRIGGAEFLEDHTGKDIVTITEELDQPSAKVMVGVLAALYIQRHPDEPKDAVLVKIRNLSLDDMGAVMAKMRATEVEPKNSPEPVVDLTETTEPPA